jgi:hypothetical protein
MGQPCDDWPLNEACSRGISADPEERTDVQAYAVSVATELLWRATAGLYGVCEVKGRPCGRKCGAVGFTYWPVQTSTGAWINVSCGCAESACGCCYVSEVKLDAPVASVTEVLIDGDIVDPATYRLDDGYKLTRVTPGEAWPMCQDLSAPPTEANTFQITYQRGIPVPVGGQYAVAALAAEVVESCSGNSCRLPSRVTDITRQGITATMINDIDFLRSGLTGIPEVDMWLTAVNPNNQRSVSSVYSPDIPRMRQVT